MWVHRNKSNSMETEQFHLLLPIQSVKSQKDLLTKLAGPKCTLPNAFLLLFEISEEAQSALSGFEMKGRLSMETMSATQPQKHLKLDGNSEIDAFNPI